LSSAVSATTVTGCQISATASGIGVTVSATATDIIVSNNQYAISTPENLSTAVRSSGAKTSGAQWRGAGSPESVVTAPAGSLFQRTDGTPGKTLYVKDAGTGTTGWLPVEVSKLACVTATGSTGAENGANTWAKIATLTAGAAFTDAHILLACTSSGYTGLPDSAIVSAYVKSQGASNTPVVRVSIAAKGETAHFITTDSFKIISDTSTAGSVATAELWVKKAKNYGTLSFYELSKSLYNSSCSVAYNDGAAWQSATPTGAVNNVSTSGVTVFGSPVITNASTTLELGGVTDTTLSRSAAGVAAVEGNPVSVRVSVPASSTAAGKPGQWAADASYIYAYTGDGTTHTWVRATAATW